ncbi:hypothetical protein HPP92_007189 [Vanilla planifolia]|uniref:Uncharacterized protein n=1 Tax=Vanilla planifolia TaxID=51239 RepID=A0A835RDU9_VANPL|nr:hypothetical protein HPP92_007419 [Vanilla planifolia]KAG0490326.1 hypothetical protein HPP92_007189 [Vanilla planifolia]
MRNSSAGSPSSRPGSRGEGGYDRRKDRGRRMSDRWGTPLLDGVGKMHPLLVDRMRDNVLHESKDEETKDGTKGEVQESEEKGRKDMGIREVPSPNI